MKSEKFIDSKEQSGTSTFLFAYDMLNVKDKCEFLVKNDSNGCNLSFQRYCCGGCLGKLVLN